MSVSIFRNAGKGKILPVCLLAVSVLFLIGDSYNPFLYFRF